MELKRITNRDDFEEFESQVYQTCPYFQILETER